MKQLNKGKETDKPLQNLKVKKDVKLEKISEAPDDVIAMALRKLMTEFLGNDTDWAVTLRLFSNYICQGIS